MNNQVIMDKFFELYKRELDRRDLLQKADHIFNADESGIDSNARAGKVIVRLLDSLQKGTLYGKSPNGYMD